MSKTTSPEKDNLPDQPPKPDEADKTLKTHEKAISTRVEKTDQKKHKTHDPKSEKSLKEIFILFRPFVALARYLRDSWREIRQVRWPNRKTTWKMTLSVLVYCVIFVIFIVLVDSFFTFVFNLLLNK